MMKFRIEKPCDKKWEEMLPGEDGKFCEFCEKKVWDLTDKSPAEISELITNNPGICGKLLRHSKNFLASSLIVTLSVSSITSCTTQTNPTNIVNAKNETALITGVVKVADGETIVENAEINLVSFGKVYRSYSNDKGEFQLEVPAAHLGKTIMISIDYTEVKKGNFEMAFNKREQFIFSKEQISEPLQIKYSDYTTIGAVVISTRETYDLHYVNGKKTSGKKFKDISKQENGFWILLESSEEKKAVIGKAYIDDVYLYFTAENIETQ